MIGHRWARPSGATSWSAIVGRIDQRARRARPSVSQNERGAEGGEPSPNAGSGHTGAARYPAKSCTWSAQ